ncbi:hypothetical protein HPP92_023789 [Vanilla planifolia]|uniref:Kinesin-like calmodulin-binding protein n=1 Tax=Vanilla planifolia TaxID=51239 RepID=A0A835PQS9_VANPL|nr:hypothetical protein HPP92_023789 [Vanilla planifolia]
MKTLNPNYQNSIMQTTSFTLPSETIGAISMVDRFQVDAFQQSLQKQVSSGKRGFFSKYSTVPPTHEKFTVEEMLCFQKDPIPTSLLKINGNLVRHSVKMFKLILKYMGVDSSGNITPLSLNERIELTAKIYKKVSKHSALHDELFMQILKQTRSIPYRTCLINAWELMFLCASSLSPSKDIEAYVTKYTHDVAHGVNMDPQVQAVASNTLNAFKHSLKVGARQMFPTHEEIEALYTNRKLKTVIYFLNNTYEQIIYDITTTVSDLIMALASSIKLSYYSSFSLFLHRKVGHGSDSMNFCNEEFIRLDDNRYIGDVLEEFKVKTHSKGEILLSKLIFKRRSFTESDEAFADPIFVQLTYIQLQHDYAMGNYPSSRKEAAKLSALQILAEIGFVDDPDSCVHWIPLLERFLPRQVARAMARREWELDILSHYNMMDHLSKDDAKLQFLRILGEFPYGNSIFFSMQTIVDPLGLLPGRLIVGINERGVHFFRPVPKELLHFAEIKSILQYGTSKSSFSIKMRINGTLNVFHFETNQGEEICLALQTHINDVMIRRNSKAKNVVAEYTQEDVSQASKHQSHDVHENHVQELSKTVQKTLEYASKLLEELHAKEKHEIEMQKELDRLKGSINSEKENIRELIKECNKLKKLFEEKDSTFQTEVMEKQNGETKLAKLQSQLTLSFKNARQEYRPEFSINDEADSGYVINDPQKINELEEDMKICMNELHTSKETLKMLQKEKLLLERKILKLEQQNDAEVSILVKNFEVEELSLQLRVSELERKLESVKESLNIAESTLTVRTAKLDTLCCSLEELEELREIKKDIDRKNEQTAALFKRQGAQISELEALYKEEQILRKKYYNVIEDMKGKIRVFCRLRPLNGKEIAEKENDILIAVDEFTVAHPWKIDRVKEHFYDYVLDQSASQDDVFESTKYLLQSAVDGFNVCIFAYGQAGSGKTFTIYGSEDHPGLVPKASAELFNIMNHDRNKFSFLLKVYMVELYQDTLVDLLLPKNAKRSRLDIKKNSKGLVSIENVTVLQVLSLEELRSTILKGAEQRHIVGSKLDGESSRSHLVLSIIIESTNLLSQSFSRGKLSFVDLASSERIKKTGSSGNQLKEAQSNNKSHSALADVINALCSEAQHIPYRNHKLTMLMSDSLGGNAKTLMFVNVSPAESSIDESYNSLMYASRVRHIMNNPSKNISSKEIAHLKKLVAYWKKQAGGKQEDDEELEEIREERQTHRSDKNDEFSR